MPVNILNKIGVKLKRQRSQGVPELLDPDSVESRLSGNDLKRPPQHVPTKAEQADVDLVMKCFNESSSAKMILERDWLTDIAQERGNPWTEIHTQSGDLQSLIDEDDPYRTYFPGNFIDPLTTKLKAKATSSRPIANTKPLTPMAQDVGAAAEGRDIKHHYDNKFDRQTQMQDVVDSCLSSSTTFLKIYWDAGKEALTSYVDEGQDSDDEGMAGSPMLNAPAPQGPAQGATQQPQDGSGSAIESLVPKLRGKIVVTSAPIGDIEEMIVPPFEIYPETTARTWDEVTWLIHAKVRSTEYIQQKYGWRGWLVKSDKDNSAASRWETRMDAITGDPVRTNMQGTNDTATVYEYWERPTARYPRGRLLRVAGGILLTDPDVTTADTYDPDSKEFLACDWPYEKNDSMPFVPLGYKNKWGTVWSTSAVRSVVAHQRVIDNIISRAVDSINMWKSTILVPMGGSIKTDSFQSRRSVNIVTYDEGRPPTYIQSPVFPAEAFELVGMLKGFMEDALGMHDPTNGVSPTPNASGVLAQELKESDDSLHAPFFANIEKACKQRLEWEIALAAQFYSEPRLVGISQEGNPTDALMNTRSFEHLTSGGQCRVEVIAGSAIPKSPAAEKQFWLDLLKSGGFTPQMFPMLKAVIDQIGLDESDTLSHRIDQAMLEVIAVSKAMNPDQGAIAQQQAQSALSAIAAKLQADMALKDKDIQGKIAVAQIDAHSDERLNALKMDSQVALRHIETKSIMDENAHSADLEMVKATHAAAVPKISLTGKLEPTGLVSAERAAGLEASHIQATEQAQPKPAAKPTNKEG